jgi:cytochrome c oxidase subunit 1
LAAVVLGAWQMLMRSPLPAPLDDPDAYYASVTLHGTVMAYVVTTFFAMGFGYAVAATSLGRPVRGMIAAWIGFAICLLGTLMAAAAVLSGRASVLYTFYPPLLGSPWYYIGFFLLVGGSMIWVVLMIVNMMSWKNENPGQAVPLAMFAVTATALLWAWSASGVLLELLGIIFPAAFGATAQIDAGLARTLFSVTLHGIVYFWLMPAYIAFYTLVPQAAGRPPLQRHDRPLHFHHVPRRVGAGWNPPSPRRPRARQRLQIPAIHIHILCRSTDDADRLLDFRQP